MNKVLYSSNTDDWSTPQSLFDKLNDEFEFTLDPASSHENHKCKKYFTIEDDGLSKSWSNNIVFCNPPYGRNIGKWVIKGYNESKNSIVVMLLPARTDTKWFHDYCLKGEIKFIRGRLKFGNSQQNAPFPSMVVIFRPENFTT